MHARLSVCSVLLSYYFVRALMGLCWIFKVVFLDDKYSGVWYNERCYNERILQRTVFINEIRMLQRWAFLKLHFCSLCYLGETGKCFNRTMQPVD
jgi:hypothetical protein